MAQWNQLQQLGTTAMQQIKSAYGNSFPIEVRYFFHEWIEQQPWSRIEEDNNQAEAQQLVTNLIMKLESRILEWANSDENFIYKLKLQEVVQLFTDAYLPKPMQLVQLVNRCLKAERALLEQAQGSKMTTEPSAQSATCVNRKVMERLEQLQRMSQETNTLLGALQYKQEAIVILLHEKTTIEQQLTYIRTQPETSERGTAERSTMEVLRSTETTLVHKGQELSQNLLNLQTKFKELLTEMKTVAKYVVEERLVEWKVLQQKGASGPDFDRRLEMLQNWCQGLTDLVWFSKAQLMRLEEIQQHLPVVSPGQSDVPTALNQLCTQLLTTMVTSTFVIEKQPPQVIRTQARFTASLRLLAGGKLNVHMNPPQVRATIVSEEQARTVLRNNGVESEVSAGQILNNTSTMEYVNNTLCVTFRNMQLKSIKRVEKKGNETVTEEKFCILFQTKFQVGSGELLFQVWTLSLPVVITVHVNQECNAMATVTWDNGFAESGREPFYVPDRVTWTALADVLNSKFSANNTGCGRPLSAENLNYLATKLNLSGEDTKTMVTWSNFNRENLPGKSFTFWQWFYSILKLTKDHLSGPWKKGLVMGFVSKQRAQELLLQPQIAPGTFLLRYSDGELGGVSIAWADEDAAKCEKQVWNLTPFTEKDFKIRSLGNRIRDLHQLTYLYPNMPKDTVFSEFYTQIKEVENQNEGYVESDLVNVIKHPQGSNWTKDYNATLMGPQSPPRADVATPKSDVGSAAGFTGLGGYTGRPDMSDIDELLNSQVMMQVDASDLDFLSTGDATSMNELLANWPMTQQQQQLTPHQQLSVHQQQQLLVQQQQNVMSPQQQLSQAAMSPQQQAMSPQQQQQHHIPGVQQQNIQSVAMSPLQGGLGLMHGSPLASGDVRHTSPYPPSTS